MTYPDNTDAGLYPKLVVIEPTTACSLKCGDCPNGQGLIPIEQIPFGAISSLRDDIFSSDYKPAVVRFAGFGEPTLWNPLWLAVILLKRAGVASVALVTSGQHMPWDLYRRLVNEGIDEIEFSLDTVNEKLYREVRGGLLSIAERAVYMIAGQKEVKIIVSMIDRWPNTDEAEKFRERFSNTDGISKVVVRQYLKLDHLGNFKYNGEPVKRWPCPQLWQRITLGVNGKYRMCCSDWKGITELEGEAPSKIWAGDTYKKYRQAHLDSRFSDVPGCGECKIWQSSRWDENSYLAGLEG